jgi:hypothetical protein
MLFFGSELHENTISDMILLWPSDSTTRSLQKAEWAKSRR